MRGVHPTGTPINVRDLLLGTYRVRPVIIKTSLIQKSRKSIFQKNKNTNLLENTHTQKQIPFLSVKKTFRKTNFLDLRTVSVLRKCIHILTMSADRAKF